MVNQSLLHQLQRTRPKLLLLAAPAGYGKSATARAYAESSVPPARVVEDADLLFGSADGRARLTELLGDLQTDRNLVVCSRVRLDLPTVEFALPHETRLVQARDLRLTRDAMREHVAPLLPSPGELDRLAALTLGWPVAVLTVRRRALESDLRTALDELSTLADPSLERYIATEVIETLSDSARTALLLAATASVALADLDILLGAEGPRVLDELGDDGSLVVRQPDGTFGAHPLVAISIERRFMDAARDAAVALANAYERAGQPYRAARWYVHAGDQTGAAMAYVKQTYTGMGTFADSADSAAAAQLETDMLVNHLAIFNVAAIEQLYIRDRDRWFAIAEEALRRAPAETPALVRGFAVNTLVWRYAYFGRFEEARAVLAAQRATFGDAPEHAGGFAIAEGFLLAAQDRLPDLGALRRGLAPLLIDPNARTLFAGIAAQWYALQGDWTAERTEFELTIEHLERAQQHGFLAEALMTGAFAAWLNLDDETFRAWFGKLERTGEATESGRELFVRCVHGAGATARERRETPQIRVRAYLIAASLEADAGVARALARRALREAERTRRPYFRILAHLSVALLDLAAAKEHVSQARILAESTPSPALQKAIDAIATGAEDAGMLAGLRARFTRERHGRGALYVRLLSMTVEWDARPVALEERPRQLLFALVLSPAALTSEELALRLWPEREPEAMLNALRVHVSAVRKALGKGAIAYEQGCYRITEPCTFDLDAHEATVSRASRLLPLGAQEHAALAALVDTIDTRARRWADREWLANVERRIEALRRAALVALAEDAQERRDVDAMLRYARRIVEHDPCDELARSLAIRAHLAAGREADASREYLEYQRALRDELGIELAHGDARSLQGLVARLARP